MTKYILVSGGVVSGIGKGVIGTICKCLSFHQLKLSSASSTGLLLKTTGLKVTAIKIDPYMNIDAGTMRPQEHGGITSNCIRGIAKAVPSQVKFTFLTTVVRSTLIWEIMNDIWT